LLKLAGELVDAVEQHDDAVVGLADGRVLFGRRLGQVVVALHQLEMRPLGFDRPRGQAGDLVLSASSRRSIVFFVITASLALRSATFSSSVRWRSSSRECDRMRSVTCIRDITPSTLSSRRPLSTR
jgi:hypothetical protein